MALLLGQKPNVQQRCLPQRNRMGEAGTSYLCWPERLMAKTEVPLIFSFPVTKKKNQEIDLFSSSLFLSWKQC